MELSLRLKTVANAVCTRTAADIGTDHGYVPIYLVKARHMQKAVACDINEGPLLRAQENVEREGVDDKIEIRLGDGLSPLSAGEVETVVLAGIGGMLIIDILRDNAEIVGSLKQLVLQPQLDVEKVRRYIHSIGFEIVDEQMVLEEDKFYTVINALAGTETYSKDIHYMYGKVNIEKKCPVLKEYLLKRLEKLSGIKERLCNAKEENAFEKADEIKKEVKHIKEVLEEYEMCGTYEES